MTQNIKQHIDFRDNLSQEDIDTWFNGEKPPKFDGIDEFTGTWLDSKLWYPAGISWEDINYAISKGIPFAKPTDLIMLPVFMVGIHLVRLVFEHFIGKPLGMWALGIIRTRSPPEKSDKLEVLYKKEKEPKSFPEIENWSKFRVKRWYRRRRNMDRPDRLKKFSETTWRFFYYFFMWTYAQVFVRYQGFVTDSYKCWESFPYQYMHKYVYFYYFTQGGFYGALLISLFTDTRRKDFYEQIAHHIVTLSLLSGSYALNFWRVGCLLLFYNDLSDWIIELSKLFIYARQKKTADFCAFVFAASWIWSRNYIYATEILHTTIIKPLNIGYKPYFGYYLFNAFLIVLGGLQVYWTYMLVKFIYRIVTTTDKKVKDDRSDAEEYTDSEEDEGAKKIN